jgi:hypothetical protein
MTIALIFAFIGVLAFVLTVLLAKGHLSRHGDLQELAAQLRRVDISAFCNLISPSEQDFLRDHLPRREFRAVHRERMLAAVEYVACAARNAAILIRLGESAQQHSDPAIRDAAQRLVDNGVRLRLYAFHTVPRLYLSMAFPNAGATAEALADTYDDMIRQVAMLTRLQFPTHGMSSAL